MSTQFKVYACYVWKQREIWLQNYKIDTKKKNAMHVNPKYKWFMKKKIGKKHRNWKFFQFRSIEHRLNINQVRLRAMIKNQGIFDRSSINWIPIESGRSWNFSIDRKSHLINRKSGKTKFLKNRIILCRNSSKHSILWIECMSMRWNVFQKHLYSTQIFQKHIFESICPQQQLKH